MVKVLRSGIPDSWSEREAVTTGLVHEAGLPAPAVLDLVTVGGRPGIVFERVEGVSMWDRMLGRPSEVSKLSLLLARLQAEVNATPAPAGLPKLRDRLRQNIQGAFVLSEEERLEAIAELEGLPDGKALCHFDIHPNNLLMAPTGPVIVDWFDAAQGVAAADIVRSSALMRPDASASHLGCEDPATVVAAHNEYIAVVAGWGEVDEEVLLRWEPVVLASRLAEPLAGDVLRSTHRTWRNLRSASDGSELGAALLLARSAPKGSDQP